MPAKLFCYGTLRSPALMLSLTGHGFRSEAALLTGFRCVYLKGQPYLGVVAAPGSVTAGRLYRGLNLRALKRLDRYEGKLYCRQRVTVRVGDHEETAFAYVIPGCRRRRIAAKGKTIRRTRYGRSD